MKSGRGGLPIRNPTLQDGKNIEAVEKESKGLSFEMLSRIYLID
jgi:hypothetical protein